MNDEQAMFIIAVIFSINLVMSVLGVIPVGAVNANYKPISQSNTVVYNGSTNITPVGQDYNPNTVEETSTSPNSTSKFGLKDLINNFNNIKNWLWNLTAGYTKFFKIIHLPPMLVTGFSGIIMFLQILALFSLSKTVVAAIRGVSI